jgi:hypothetical protein
LAVSVATLEVQLAAPDLHMTVKISAMLATAVGVIIAAMKVL